MVEFLTMVEPLFYTFINVASRETDQQTNRQTGQKQYVPHYYRKKPPPPGGHVFQATGTNFELVQDIIGTNFLTKFHDDRTINVASRVLTRFTIAIQRTHVYPDTSVTAENSRLTNLPDYPTRKMPRPLGGHVFQSTGIIF
ncbi:hypothetical protein DPMN_073960 [Dreissena polymorpha]|uniref:Uncharacterized protein n=1 Tax=Dreissena polymorpha TaxID=45954 RepID=A0A9D3YEB7_DREPO|nr:hypothetical protein DPMN_073960 [Dreissena polymorpha]